MATVLLVDDDPTILVVTEAALRGSGYEVLAFDDPCRAMAEIEGKKASFDAAVLDVMMPGHSGYDLLNQLRAEAKTRAVPVLFLSSLDSAPERIRGLREGADDYLGKPFEPEELVLRVDRLVERAAGAAESEVAEEAEDGKFGRYEVLDVLGEGSMGTVFKGWDPKLQRPVALKTVKLNLTGSSLSHSDLVSRLLHEAVMGARCSHPNIVAIYDVGDSPAAAFIAMEYVEGPSLELYLAHKDPIPEEEVIYVSAQVAQALAAAHDSDLVHHDVKPGNVMLGTASSVKVTDFGLANWISGFAETSGRVFGTPGFLAPEALRGDGYTRASDLFGLGAVMFRCLTGEQAFPGRTIAGVVANTLGAQVAAPSAFTQGLNPDLDALILELLAKRPEDRPGSAKEVAQRLEAMIDGPPPQWPANLERTPVEETLSTDLGRSRMLELPTLSGGSPAIQTVGP